LLVSKKYAAKHLLKMFHDRGQSVGGLKIMNRTTNNIGGVMNDSHFVTKLRNLNRYRHIRMTAFLVPLPFH